LTYCYTGSLTGLQEVAYGYFGYGRDGCCYCCCCK